MGQGQTAFLSYIQFGHVVQNKAISVEGAISFCLALYRLDYSPSLLHAFHETVRCNYKAPGIIHWEASVVSINPLKNLHKKHPCVFTFSWQKGPQIRTDSQKTLWFNSQESWIPPGRALIPHMSSKAAHSSRHKTKQGLRDKALASYPGCIFWVYLP